MSGRLSDTSKIGKNSGFRQPRVSEIGDNSVCVEGHVPQDDAGLVAVDRECQGITQRNGSPRTGTIL